MRAEVSNRKEPTASYLGARSALTNALEPAVLTRVIARAKLQ
jgi:hypothetical protein